MYHNVPYLYVLYCCTILNFVHLSHRYNFIVAFDHIDKSSFTPPWQESKDAGGSPWQNISVTDPPPGSN